MNKKLCIAIPNTGVIKAQTAFCLHRMVKALKCEYGISFKEGSILHWNRESLVKKAIEGGFTHLLFVDTDMSFEADAANILLERDKDIIGANYHLRKFPVTSVTKMSEEKLKTLKEDHPDGLFPCDAVGTGFMLINLDVFKNLSHPWFFWESDEQGEVVTGEDFWFCRKAREAGYEVWCDLTVEVKHIGDYLF